MAIIRAHSPHYNREGSTRSKTKRSADEIHKPLIERVVERRHCRPDREIERRAARESASPPPKPLTTNNTRVNAGHHLLVANNVASVIAHGARRGVDGGAGATNAALALAFGHCLTRTVILAYRRRLPALVR